MRLFTCHTITLLSDTGLHQYSHVIRVSYICNAIYNKAFLQPEKEMPAKGRTGAARDTDMLISDGCAMINII